MADPNTASRSPDERQRRTETNHLNSPLLRLPAELRNRVFTLAFHARTIQVNETHPDYLLPSPTTGPLLTCRQMHYEALPIFHSTCIFDFQDSLNSRLPQTNRYATIRFIKIRRFTTAMWNTLLGPEDDVKAGDEGVASGLKFAALEECVAEEGRWPGTLNHREVLRMAIRQAFGRRELKVLLWGE
ncbi:hypothetical protein T440DRAFT_558293 [Plenodomus tracheiphilus IPT5]|uniref:F-box domain-containing protein n=1 Tax=Plenodomus tracheiphilus IPT5 TaxID=1408161 RepID=A0A6A7AVU9_9PLEO|nr:hypothetical protein T440DRAFT_558293 [Plenodomus tracheiphilus IPT5]